MTPTGWIFAILIVILSTTLNMEANQSTVPSPQPPNEFSGNIATRHTVQSSRTIAFESKKRSAVEHDHTNVKVPRMEFTNDQVGGAILTSFQHPSSLQQSSGSSSLSQAQPLPTPSSLPTQSIAHTSSNDWQSSLPGPSHQPDTSTTDESQLLMEDVDPSGEARSTPTTTQEQPSATPEDKNEKRYLISYSLTAPKIFKNRSAKSFIAKPTSPSMDYKEEIEQFKRQLTPFLEKEMELHYQHGMLVHLCGKVTYNVIKEGKLVDTPSFLFPIKSKVVLRDDDIAHEIDPSLQRLEKFVADQQEKGSGFVFKVFDHILVTLARFTPVRAGHYIPSPRYISRRKATLNIKTQDDKCILDCLVASQHPVASSPQLQSHYRPYRDEINVEGIKFPIDKRGIDKLEGLNPQFSINVYAYEDKGKGKKGQRKIQVYPYRISKNRGEDKQIVNMLLLEDDNSPRRHFILIKDLGRLTRSGNSNHRQVTYCCPYCIQHFTNERLLTEHRPKCEKFKPIATRYPEEGKNDRLSFTQYEKQQPAQYIAFFDYETREVLRTSVDQPPECPLSPEVPRKFPWIKFPMEMKHVEGGCRVCTTTKPCPKIQKSTETHCRLEPFSFAFKIVSTSGPEHDFPLRLYQGPDASKKFLRQLKEDMQEVNSLLRRNVPMQMTEAEKRRHAASTRCNVCNKKYTKQNRKVS